MASSLRRRPRTDKRASIDTRTGVEARIVFLVWALVLAACSNAALQAYQAPAPAPLDDLVQVQASVCTSAAQPELFPVKILFLVDTSLSMTVTDRTDRRSQAVLDVINRYQGNPAVEFGVIAFDSAIDNITNGFTSSPDTSAIATRLQQADNLTDYQGAFSAAYTMISLDLENASPATRARSKYVVIFFTDGTPDPECAAGVQSAQYAVCYVPRENWGSAFSPPVDPSLYPALQAGGDYNQPYQIYQAVDNIVNLENIYRVAEVQVNTAFLFDPAAAADPLYAAFNLNQAAGESLLTEVAAHGGGTFTEFDAGVAINFLNIDYSSIQESNGMADIFVTNLNAFPDANGYEVDTDGDGLSDAEEFAIGTCSGITGQCPNPVDTDGDHYSDFVEYMLEKSGFNPLDPNLPSQKFSSYEDQDHDGLVDADEAAIGSDPRLFDTDGDRMPDLLEVKNGLNPLDPTDAYQDPDHDGIYNIDEVRQHTNPHVFNAQNDPNKYSYDVQAANSLPDGQLCYNITVKNIRLVTTGLGNNSPRGYNRIYLYFVEAPQDSPLDFGDLRMACVDTRYIDGVVKSPANGIISLTDSQIVMASQFDPTVDCINMTGVTPP